jgi:hypothetical protein
LIRAARLRPTRKASVHRHRHAGPRVPALPGFPLFYGEGAETAQFHPPAACERLGDLIEDRGHDQLSMRLSQVRRAGGEIGDEV